MYNSSGFTLIESLLVLFIISIFMSFTIVINNDKALLLVQAKTIQNILYIAKAQAINEYKSKIITIDNKSISIDETSYTYLSNVVCNEYIFSINAKGNSSMANTITCYLNDESIDIVVHIGNGDYYVKQ